MLIMAKAYARDMHPRVYNSKFNFIVVPELGISIAVLIEEELGNTVV